MYGVVSFYAVLQGVLIFADAGLTASLKRELAKGNDSIESRKRKYKIFRSIETVYLLIVLLIGIFIFVGADYIVQKWLNIQDLEVLATRQGIQIMGFALALNFLSRLYQGGILGLEKQVHSNVLQISWGVLKNVGVILALIAIDKTLNVFFIWNLSINLIYVLVLRNFLFKTLKKSDGLLWKLFEDFKALKGIWRYASGMLIISIIAAINSQIDKIVLSKTLTVSELAIYTVAYSLSTVPVVLSGPIATAIFPRLTRYYSQSDTLKLHKTFNNSFNLVLLVTSIAGLTLALYADFFIEIWTGNIEIAHNASLPAFYLLLAQILLSFQIIPFNLSLARGNTRINIYVGLIGIIFLIPAMFYSAKTYGMVGVAVTSFIYFLISTPIYIGLVVTKFTNLQFFKWFLENNLRPLVLIFAGSLIFYFINAQFVLSNLFKAIYILVSTALLFILGFRIMFNVNIKNTISFIKNELFA